MKAEKSIKRIYGNSLSNELPNIIYILADDMGYGDVSCLNTDSKLNTTNLDKLARGGMVFTDAHSTSAVCTPSRYSILTGRYSWRSTLKQGVLFGYDAPLIEGRRMTVASMLGQLGYKTACIGKWHLGLGWQRFPGAEKPEEVDFNQPVLNGPVTLGFDYFFGIPASLDMAPYVYVENDRVTAIPDHVTRGGDMERKLPFAAVPKTFWREGITSPDFIHNDVLPLMTKKVLQRMEMWRDNPFFIYFPLTAPHTPILPAAEFAGKSGTNEYGDFVLMVDHIVGEIMNKLRELELEENTIVVFTSDNGCSPSADFMELATYGHNPSYHFRGHKADIYEGGHRIPMIVRWPEVIQPGGVSNQLVSQSDLMATLADITGFNLPDDAGEDSISNLQLWTIQDDQISKADSYKREAMVHHSINGSFSIRWGKWKLELCPGSGGWSNPRPGMEPEGSPRMQLYDLDIDVRERINVCREYPDVVKNLTMLFAQYVREGRSKPGTPQRNDGPKTWPQLTSIAHLL